MNLDDLIGKPTGDLENNSVKEEPKSTAYWYPFRDPNIKWSERPYTWGDYKGVSKHMPPKNHALAWKIVAATCRLVDPSESLLKAVPYASSDSVIVLYDTLGGKHTFWEWRRKKHATSNQWWFHVGRLIGWDFKSDHNVKDLDLVVVRQHIQYTLLNTLECIRIDHSEKVADMLLVSWEVSDWDYQDWYWGEEPF